MCRSCVALSLVQPLLLLLSLALGALAVGLGGAAAVGSMLSEMSENCLFTSLFLLLLQVCFSVCILLIVLGVFFVEFNGVDLF